jgi:hypothetical protein
VEEDELLRQSCSIHGKAWVKVAEMIPGRTQRQCRTRHLILEGLLKKGPTAQEDSATPELSMDLSQDMSGMDEYEVDRYSDSDDDDADPDEVVDFAFFG